MGEGGGQQSFKIKVGTGASVQALDTLTQAAIVARGAIKALNAAGGQQAMLAAAAAARANAEAQKASAMAAKAVAEQARAAAPMLRAQAAADVAAARASKIASDERNATAKVQAQLATEGSRAAKMAADATRAQIAADRAAEDAATRKAAATKSASASAMEGAQAVKGYANQILDLAQKAGEAAQALYGMAAEGQKLKQLETAFKTLGGNAAEMDKLRLATGGVVDDATLQRVYNLGSLFELPKQHIPDLIRLAKGASVALGQTVAKSLEDTFTAASRGSKMIADNMGIVIGDLEPRYAEFAKKAGKSVDSLTDKEKQLVFIQTMVAKGGRQIDLAAAASSNQFASAEAQITNFVNSLKMGLAETFVASGAFDAMGRALDTVKGMFAANGDQIANIVMPAFSAVVQILPIVGGLFATLLPVLQPLTTALGTVSATMQLVTPLLGVAIGLFSGLVNVILQVVNTAIKSLLFALREVVALYSDDMARAIDGSIRALEQSVAPTDAASVALHKQAEAAKAAATEHKALMAVLAGKGFEAAAKTGLGEGLDLKQITAAMDYTMSANAANMRALAGQIGRDSAEEFGEKYRLRGEDAMKQAAAKMAYAYVKEAGIGGPYGDYMVREITKVYQAATPQIIEEQRKAEARRMKNAINTTQEMLKLYSDAAQFGTTTVADSAIEGAKTQAEALAKLEKQYEMYYAAIEKMDLSAPVMESTTAKLNDLFNYAGEQIDAHFNKKNKDKGGGRGPDYARAIEEAKAALMEEGERNIYDIRKKYSEMAEALPKKEKDLRVALEKQAMAEIINLEDERRKRVEDARLAGLQAQKDEARALTDFLATEDQRRIQQAIRAIEDEAAARRNANTFNPAALAMIAAQEQRALQKLKQDQVADSSKKGMDAARAAAEAQTKEMEKSRKNAQQWASTFQTAGNTVVDAMFSVAGGSVDMREAVFKTMGSLFGQLSTAYLAWANTEIAMFSGNPWLGAVAAVALGAVASAISSFGTRGKGGSGASSGSASREVRNRESDEKRGGPNITINAMGFTTADDVARAVAKGELRGNELTGRSADRRTA